MYIIYIYISLSLSLLKQPPQRDRRVRGRTLCSEQDHDLGMDALIIECTRIGRLLWFGHGCSSDRMLLEHERSYGLGMDAPVTVCPSDRMLLEHERSYGLGMDAPSDRMLLEHERYYGLGMMVWAWMLQ